MFQFRKRLAVCTLVLIAAYTQVSTAARPVKEYYVSTVGNAAVRAKIHYPWTLTLDSKGNLYISNNGDWRILKLTPQGTITTVAGDGKCCIAYDGVQATRSAIGTYSHMAVGPNGSLYISNYGSQRVRKVSPDGIIRTVAGTGTAGFSGDGGPATAAELNYPTGIALDAAGNLYIADSVNYRVRKVAPDGIISTFAGNGKAGHSGDGGPAREAEATPQGLAMDSTGDLYILGSGIRKISPEGIISTVANIPAARSITVGARGTVYAVTAHHVIRLSAHGNLETIAGADKPGPCIDGTPALDAWFKDLGGIAVDRQGRIYVADGNRILRLYLAPIRPLKPSPQEPRDLKVELRSATGSNRFQIGQEIPLEVTVSSGTPNRYLEPCDLFNESTFGFPQCRYFNRWSFSVRPARGWVDLRKEFPTIRTGGGPTIPMPNSDLSSRPVTYRYTLTHRFRFYAPGTYYVRLTLSIGLDDDTTQRKTVANPKIHPHAVSVEREIKLKIVAASPGWQAEVVRKGVQAYSTSFPPRAHPDSQEIRENQEARNALCNLGTPEAAQAYANLLAQNGIYHQEVERCLEHIASRKAAIADMERLLVDPNTAIHSNFFRVLVVLLGRNQSKMAGFPLLSQKYVDAERQKLFAALPQKSAKAQVASLLTVLAYPPRTKGNAWEAGHDLPLPPPVIAAAASDFDRFPAQSQEWLLEDEWARIRSPLMLPVVRRLAKNGNGYALLRWLELDPPAARAFVRGEIVRPKPRFSSFYLRLPDTALPGQEAQIAANFVAQTNTKELMRSATLLYRYATGAVLPTVLPFIDAKESTWPCSVLFPTLAFLLKVSPTNAEQRLRLALAGTHRWSCQPGSYAPESNNFFTDLGFLEPSPVLDRLALGEIDKGPGPLADNAATYLRNYGSPSTKSLLYDQIARWRHKFVESGGEERVERRKGTNEDNALANFVTILGNAYAGAQGWLLSPKEAAALRALMGAETTSREACTFHCGASLGTGKAPGRYLIYSWVNQRFNRKPSPFEFLNPRERLHYNINQYCCCDLKALKNKISQFPAGSTFDFVWNFTAADKNEILEIADFLRAHGYRIGSTHNWTFLRPDLSQKK